MNALRLGKSFITIKHNAVLTVFIGIKVVCTTSNFTNARFDIVNNSYVIL